MYELLASGELLAMTSSVCTGDMRLNINFAILISASCFLVGSSEVVLIGWLLNQIILNLTRQTYNRKRVRMVTLVEMSEF